MVAWSLKDFLYAPLPKYSILEVYIICNQSIHTVKSIQKVYFLKELS